MTIDIIFANRDELAALCQSRHVRRLSVFGSAARAYDFTDKSDIDFVVEFEPDYAPPPLREFLAFRGALADLLGREVDLVVAGAVRNPFIQASIDRSSVVVHGA